MERVTKLLISFLSFPSFLTSDQLNNFRTDPRELKFSEVLALNKDTLLEQTFLTASAVIRAGGNV
jgi:hypothetical protein